MQAAQATLMQFQLAGFTKCTLRHPFIWGNAKKARRRNVQRSGSDLLVHLEDARQERLAQGRDTTP